MGMSNQTEEKELFHLNRFTNTVIPKGQRFFIFLDEDEVFSVPTSRIEARDYRIIGVIFRCLMRYPCPAVRTAPLCCCS